jgi:shikimate kinase
MSEAKPRRIVILGFMGAGKTTVARALAQQLNSQMTDLDAMIVAREQRDISDLIREEGEAQFRNKESYLLRIVLEGKSTRIIALGGGTWTIEKNRSLLAQHECVTIWLDAPFELCWKRITNEEVVRPLALDRKISYELYLKRRPLYELAAWQVGVTEERSADELASEIINLLRRERHLKH